MSLPMDLPHPAFGPVRPIRTVRRRALWRLLLALGVMLSLAPHPGARAQTDPAADPRAASEAVIRAQLKAFNQDDAEGAFSHASPGIRAMFGTSATFMTMVQQGYRPIWRNRAARVLSARTGSDGRFSLDVLIQGQAGDGGSYRYFMEQQPDGLWKIDGVMPLPAQQA